MAAEAATDPSQGARRREALLLVAYVVLVTIGVWTVVVSELATQAAALRDPASVTLPPQKSRPAGD